MVSDGCLTKFKHLQGNYLFDRSTLWRSTPLATVNEQRNRTLAEEAALQLYELYFIQYNTFYCTVKGHYLQHNLDVYKAFWHSGRTGFTVKLESPV